MKSIFRSLSRTKTNIRSILLALTLVVFFVPFANGQYQTNQKAVTQKINSYIGGYLESLPNDYNSNSSKKYPLLIFVHGKGEIGDGSEGALSRVSVNGPPRMIKQGTFPASFVVNGTSHSFIVISPQITTNAYSSAHSFLGELLAYLKTRYRIDENRVYITGLSMGGGMTWRFMATEANAKAIAAAVPVSGSVDKNSTIVKNIVSNNVPIWATHNNSDPTVSSKYTKNWVAAINGYSPAPNPTALMSIFEVAAHDAWTKTYDVNFKVNGKNVYEWMLSYSRGNSSANPSTTPPTAKAGSNQVLNLPGNSVVVDGSGSTPSSGSSITAYQWVKTSGGNANIASPNAAKTEITGLVQGSYVFTLTVTDKNGQQASSSLTVTVNAAQAPVANAGSNQTITLPTNSVTLNGSNSTTPAGSITSYAWAKTSGGNATIANASSSTTAVSGLAQGTYVFTLTVTNSGGAKSSSTVTITVNAAQAPVANAGSNQTITLPTNSVTLDGSKSTTPAGSITSYSWAKTSGGSATIASASSAKTTVSGMVQGSYVFTLTVTNSGGAKATSTVTITVDAALQAPVAVAGGNHVLTLPGNSVVVDGSKSTPAPGSSIASYQWTKTTGGNANIVTPNAVRSEILGLGAGNYVFTLTVTDKNGEKSTSSLTVLVNTALTATKPDGNIPSKDGGEVVIGAPTAVAGGNHVLTLPGNSVVVDGSKSTPAPGSSITSYQWVKTSGGNANIVTPNAARSEILGLSAGDFVFTLTVTDKNGLQSASSLTVKVNPAVVGPNAVAGNNHVLVLPGNSVVVDGGQSTPAPGSAITSYQWVKTSGGNANIVTPNAARSEILGLGAGDYVFTLTVTDKNGLKSSSSLTVKVYAAAPAPIAVAGGNHVLTLPGNSVVVDGSNSTPSIGSSIVSYQWVKTSGGNANIVTPNSARSEILGLGAGDYVFTLTVTDKNGLKSSSSLTVKVNPNPASARSASSSVVNGESTTDVSANLGQNVNGSTNNKLELKASPNPAVSNVNLSIQSDVVGKTSVLVYNLQGKLVQQQEFNKDVSTPIVKSLSVSSLTPGIYLIQVVIANTHKQTVRIVKQ